jgi:hypothetical protein
MRAAVTLHAAHMKLREICEQCTMANQQLLAAGLVDLTFGNIKRYRDLRPRIDQATVREASRLKTPLTDSFNSCFSKGVVGGSQYFDIGNPAFVCNDKPQRDRP